MSPDLDTLLLELHLSGYRRLFEQVDHEVLPDPNGQARVSVAVETVGRREFTTCISVVEAHGIMYGSGIGVPAGAFTQDELDDFVERTRASLLALVQTHDWSNAPFVTDADFRAAQDQLDYLIEKSS